jgi:1,2-diacylglycerol 3-alpha-glucosyltransferase
MKIGFFTDTYFPQINGVCYVISHWKEELERQGHEVFVYYPHDKEYEPKKNEVPIKSISFLFYQGYRLGMPLPHMQKVEKDLDIVHIHGFATMAALGLAVSHKRKIPSILTYHTPADIYIHYISSNPYVIESLQSLYKFYERELLDRCKIITAPSKVIVDYIKKRAGKKLVHPIVLSNGVDTNFFKEVDSSKFKKDYNIPSGTVIGFAGRHSKEKHVEELIAIADSFKGTILIAGKGPASEELRKISSKYKNVMFLGFLPRERLPEFYSSLDAFVFPSQGETQGLVALEANACRRPVVAADSMALSETVKDRINGYKYKPGDIRDLKTKLKKVLAEKELRTSAKKEAEQHSLENVIDSLLKLYKQSMKDNKE